jgi:hypothetical protein
MYVYGTFVKKIMSCSSVSLFLVIYSLLVLVQVPSFFVVVVAVAL